MRYMLLIYGEEAGMTAEAMADMTPWIAYSTWLEKAGLHVGGEPLALTSSATTVRVREGRTNVTDGPFAETKEALGGYYIIEASDLDTALDAAARCPGALYGSIEVRPMGQMPTAEAAAGS